MTVYYLGQFPPPYGGVTVKNAMIFKAISERMPITKLEFRKDSTIRILAKALLSTKEDFFIFGFGSADLQRKMVIGLGKIRPSVLKRSIAIIMGGEIAAQIASDKRYLKASSLLRSLYFEHDTMIRKVEDAGINNAKLFPNCRVRGNEAIRIHDNRDKLKAVFFSLISMSKGADLVIEAARITPGIEYHFYGEIEDDYRDDFLRNISDLDNVTYHGIFDSSNENVIRELMNYDVHVFPSRWPKEGVPGVIVETKLAGIPTIASKICLNEFLIEDEISGLILDDMSSECLASYMIVIDEDREFLNQLKIGALASAQDYYLDKYIEDVIKDIEGEDGK